MGVRIGMWVGKWHFAECSVVFPFFKCSLFLRSVHIFFMLGVCKLCVCLTVPEGSICFQKWNGWDICTFRTWFFIAPGRKCIIFAKSWYSVGSVWSLTCKRSGATVVLPLVSYDYSTAVKGCWFGPPSAYPWPCPLLRPHNLDLMIRFRLLCFFGHLSALNCDLINSNLPAGRFILPVSVVHQLPPLLSLPQGRD